MTKNLKTADNLAKVTLSVSVVLLFLGQAISGPFATIIAILAALVILIFSIKALLIFLTRD